MVDDQFQMPTLHQKQEETKTHYVLVGVGKPSCVNDVHKAHDHLVSLPTNVYPLNAYPLDALKSLGSFSMNIKNFDN